MKNTFVKFIIRAAIDWVLLLVSLYVVCVIMISVQSGVFRLGYINFTWVELIGYTATSLLMTAGRMGLKAIFNKWKNNHKEAKLSAE